MYVILVPISRARTEARSNRRPRLRIPRLPHPFAHARGLPRAGGGWLRARRQPAPSLWTTIGAGVYFDSSRHPRPMRSMIVPNEYNFTVVLEPIEEGGFLVLVPALPEVVTHGETET